MRRPKAANAWLAIFVVASLILAVCSHYAAAKGVL